MPAIDNYALPKVTLPPLEKAGRFYARSASDRTEDWPFWFVADSNKGGLNVTGPLFEKLTGERAHGAVFAPRDEAKLIAAHANQAAADG